MEGNTSVKWQFLCVKNSNYDIMKIGIKYVSCDSHKENKLIILYRGNVYIKSYDKRI